METIGRHNVCRFTAERDDLKNWHGSIHHGHTCVLFLRFFRYGAGARHGLMLRFCA